MDQGKITIHAVSTQDQIADLLTKPLAEREFTRIKYKIMEKRWTQKPSLSRECEKI